jgi:hypothetical protein
MKMIMMKKGKAKDENEGGLLESTHLGSNVALHRGWIPIEEVYVVYGF